jgi:hypothetical protein
MSPQGIDFKASLLVKYKLKIEFGSVAEPKTKQRRKNKNMKKLTTIAAAAALVAIGHSAQAQITLISPNTDDTSPIAGAVYTPTGTLEDSISSGFSLSGVGVTDAGSLASSVYTGGLQGGEVFVYTFTLTSGDIDGITVSGFSGNLDVSSTLGLNELDYSDGAIDFTLSSKDEAPTTVTFVVQTSQTGFGGTELAYKDQNAGDIATLAPVPEPSSIMAGALMLLPLGIGAVRAIRKERAA